LEKQKQQQHSSVLIVNGGTDHIH